MNKYTKWYNQIINRARNRIIDGYTESHHIIPESLGGPDTPENLVELTAREHFICHWLLVKMTIGEDHWKMVNALRMMRAEKSGQQRYKTKITARVYESLKKEYSILQSEKKRGENNPMYGDKFYRSEEGKQRQRKAILGDNNGAKQETAREKITNSKLGKKRAPFSEEWRANMAEKKKGENNPRFGVEVLESTRQKIGDKIRGRKQTNEEKARRSAANRGKVKPKQLCPHCQQMIAVNTYPRWHGDNCKHNKGTP
jgi:hypothetical protein